jgi:bifunctional non-homologous end joining protein LigD
MVGDPSADMDAHAGRLDALLKRARRDEDGGLGDAPWPPHFAKQAAEPRRVQPSKHRQDE